MARKPNLHIIQIHLQASILSRLALLTVTRPGGSHSGRVWQLVVGGIVFCSLVELMQLLVYSRFCKIEHVILGSLARYATKGQACQPVGLRR